MLKIITGQCNSLCFVWSIWHLVVRGGEAKALSAPVLYLPPLPQGLYLSLVHCGAGFVSETRDLFCCSLVSPCKSSQYVRKHPVTLTETKHAEAGTQPAVLSFHPPADRTQGGVSKPPRNSKESISPEHCSALKSTALCPVLALPDDWAPYGEKEPSFFW